MCSPENIKPAIVDHSEKIPVALALLLLHQMLLYFANDPKQIWNSGVLTSLAGYLFWASEKMEAGDSQANLFSQEGQAANHVMFL